MIRITALVALLMLATPAGATLVRLDTSAGPITIRLERRRAPVTTANFLRYVTSRRFDGTSFYRAARGRTHPRNGLIQGGIDRRLTKAFLPIAHEPTSKTGLRHDEGAVSMARNAPGTATGNFFIIAGSATSLDARAEAPGYAVFGHVVSGMDVVRRILALPTYPGGYSEVTKGQTIVRPVRIVSARRIPG